MHHEDWISEEELDEMFSSWMGEKLDQIYGRDLPPGMKRTQDEIRALPEVMV